MAAFASSSQVPCKNYEVFISFRGADVRDGFLSHLVKELRRKSIEVYVDDRLERGKEISSELEKAIEESMIALVIFSKDYASSEWCLEELVQIMKRKDADQQIVIPIFYHVDPSYVRHQKLAYADAFILHEKNFKDRVEIWRSVLERSADLSGYHSSKFRNESQLIDSIVKGVLKKLVDNSPTVAKSQLIGFRQNFTSVESLMEIKSQEARILGIWGMGGIGKTTLAFATFDKFSSEFESHCFLEDVRKKSLKSLRHELFSELLDQTDHINMNDAMRRLQRKKVLVVLDDVDNPMQLKDLAAQHLLLGQGSRIIITSRDRHVLKSGGIHDKYIHEVEELNFEESLKLFSIHAFNQSHPQIGYQELSETTIAIAKGIPLALEVLGSHFLLRDKGYWESELRKLQKYPHQNIQDILKISYDGLNPMDKEIFLDIAFFFMGRTRDEIVHGLEACGFEAVSGIQNIMDKALIKSTWDNIIVMHDLIREMAEQIVREEDYTHPERRSRLKDTNEICDILESNMGTHEIQGIILETRQHKSIRLEADIFLKMKKLRILKLSASIELPFGLDYFPNKLSCLHWDDYPLEYLPSGSCFKHLVELHMENSNVKKLWDGKQDLGNLKKINLRHSEQLMELPDLSMAHRLEIVDLPHCGNLRSVHPSILSLHTIVEMNLVCCSKLESLESETHLESLLDVYAYGCDSLKRFSLSSKKLRRINMYDCSVELLHLLNGHYTELRELAVDGERLESLPINELRCLTNLESFEVRNFKQVIDSMELHSLFDAWRNLRTLNLSGWSWLKEIPDSIKSLTKLEYLLLYNSAVETLPAWVNHLSSLIIISLNSCERLKSILGLPPMLEALDASDCTLLEIVSSDSLPGKKCCLYFYNCVNLNKRSLRFIEELTHSDGYVEACYPGSRVPEWMKYKHMTQPSNVIEFTCNLEQSLALVLCCVAHVDSCFDRIFCDIFYDDVFQFDNTYEIFNFNYPDHVFLWPQGELTLDGIKKGNDVKISCKFSLGQWNDKCEEQKVVAAVKGCGVHLIETEWGSNLQLAAEASKYYSQSESEPESGRKRKRDADICVEDRLPPTK